MRRMVWKGLLAETARNVGFRFFFRGIGEDLGRFPVFHQAAHVHEGGPVRDACGLLHVMGDDDNGDGEEDESSNKTRASNKRKKDEQDGDDKASKKRNDTTCIDDTENGDDKKMKDAQKASSKKLNVPVDEGCYMGGNGSTA